MDEANLKISNAPTNGYILSAQSDESGGLTWVDASGVGGNTNLTSTTAVSNITINSSSGNNVAIAEASGTIAGVMTVAHHDKLDGIEASATADQSNAEIRAAVEAATDSNVFTDADHSKLNGIEASATADQTVTDSISTTSSTIVASATAVKSAYDRGSTGITNAAAAAQTANAALPKAGGAMTGAITTNSTFDGVDIASRDSVLTSTTTTANAALPKAGGEMSGNITFSGSQTVDGKDVSTLSTAAEAHAYVEANALALTAALTTNSTIDGVDIATRDGVLTSTTATANAALPKTGGAMTGAITTNSTFDGVDVAAAGTLATNAMPKSGGAFTGAVTTNSTIDGRDVAADGVLATNALPKSGGTMSGAIAMGNQNITGGGTITGTVLTGTSLVADHITVDGNTVSTTDTNGNLLLAANGTGKIEVRGNTNSAAVILNCEENSHGVTIQAPAHDDFGGSYTLTLPADNGDADQVLKTNGSGVLDWVDQAGGQLTTEAVQDISGALVASGGTKTNIAVTYDDVSNNMDFVVASDLNTTGNAGTATALATARAINGVNFNGTQAITVPAAGSTLTDTVTVEKGGTGATSLTNGGILLGSGTAAVTAMAVLTNGQMIVGDGTTDPVAESGATLRTSIGCNPVEGSTSITTTGALGTGTIVSGFGSIDNGSSTLNTGALTAASLVCTAAGTFGGGYGSTGATISTAGVGQFNGALTTDAALTAASIDIGTGGADINGTLEANVYTLGGTNIMTGSVLTTAGTISAGVWQGTAIASAYLDSDTAHLTTDQTFTGVKQINLRKFPVSSATDGNAIGDVVYFGGTTSMTIGKMYHYKSDGTWEIVNADAVATSDGLLGVALGAASDTNGMLLRGMVTLDHDPGAIGDVLYIQSDNAGVPGNATATAPAANGDCVRVIGYQVSHASNGQIWFNPSNDFIEISA